MTGDRTLTARFLFQEFFEFEPTFKVWLAANHKPAIRGTDDGIWRRIRLIPFTVTIPDEEKDRHLVAKLKEELPGILWWAISGCLDWKSAELGICAEVRAATQKYRTEMDVLATFINDCCINQGYNLTVPKTEMFSAYESWCEKNSEDKLSKKLFGVKMAERGMDDYKSGSVRFWKGIRLKTDQERDT